MDIRIASGLLLALAGCQQAAAPAPAPGPDFACSNTQLELRCTPQGCTPTPAGEFTAMQLSRSNGMVELCAYSGCSQGQPDLAETKGGVEFIHVDLGAPNGAAAILLDSGAGTATLRTDGFLVPMECGQQ